MNRMNSGHGDSGFPESEFLATLLVGQQKAVGKLPDAKLLSSIQEQLMKEIIFETEKAEKIEELVELEMMYQKLDPYFATSDADLKSIKIAQAEYSQVMDTIGQMRRNPVEYLASNKSARETHGDLRIIDRTKALEQIQGNKTRLRNRTNFASSEWRGIWKARIALADKTEKMYRALHNKLVGDYERNVDVIP